MDLSPAAKEEAEVKIKLILNTLVELIETVGTDVVKQTENKVDDVLAPVLAPLAKEALKSLIDGIKL